LLWVLWPPVLIQCVGCWCHTLVQWTSTIVSYKQYIIQ
jgi:hypothetical protein